MNICTDNLPRLTKFYKTLFELGTITDDAHTVISRDREDRAYTGKVDFLTDGDIEFHWAERDLDTGFKLKKFVNQWAMGTFASELTISKASCVDVMHWGFATLTMAVGQFLAGTKFFYMIQMVTASKCTNLMFFN